MAKEFPLLCVDWGWSSVMAPVHFAVPTSMLPKVPLHHTNRHRGNEQHPGIRRPRLDVDPVAVVEAAGSREQRLEVAQDLAEGVVELVGVLVALAA